MKFMKYAPNAAYQNMVAYFWTLKSTVEEEATGNYRFVPDGYVDWIFHLAAPWKYRFPKEKAFTEASQFHVFG